MVRIRQGCQRPEFPQQNSVVSYRRQLRRNRQLDELNFLRCECRRDVDQLFITLIKLHSLGVDCENLAGFNRVCLLQNRVAVFIQNRVAVCVQLLDPVLQVNADAAGYANSGQEDWGDAIGASNNRRDVDERNVWLACLPVHSATLFTPDIREEPTPMVPFSAISMTRASGCAFCSS